MECAVCGSGAVFVAITGKPPYHHHVPLCGLCLSEEWIDRGFKSIVELSEEERDLIHNSLESLRGRLFNFAKELGFDVGSRELVTRDYYLEVGCTGQDQKYRLFKIWVGDSTIEGDLDFEISPRTGHLEQDAVDWLRDLKKRFQG